MREDCEEGSASDSIQVFPSGNTSFLLRPTRTAGLPVSFRHLYKFSCSSGMFWRAAMSPGGRGEAGGTSSHQHRQEGSSIRSKSGVALRQHNLPSRVPMLLKSTLVIESSLMSPVRTSLPQPFKLLSLILESHSTMGGVISPGWVA